MKKYVILVFVILLLTLINAQTITNTNALQALANRKYNEHRKNRAEVEEYAKKNNIPVRQTLPDGTIIEMQYLENGKPFYYMTNNLGAAQTTRADDLWDGGSLGLNVTGSGYDKLGLWDEGGVLLTHQELNGRVTQVDVPNTILSPHSTHVAGTLIATGIKGDAKGMAYESNLDAYDWEYDETEMALAASDGMEVSNHSYGIGAGWLRTYNGSEGCYDIFWYGDVAVSTTEDYNFGYYSSQSAEWDEIAYDATYYLIVKSAGNDRFDDFVAGCTGDQHYYWWHGGWVLSSASRDPDGGANGYDCIPIKGAAKNILTIGAVEEVSDYSEPSDVVMSDFSGWGPVDDGRIKPDLVGKGVLVYSTHSLSNIAYGTGSGTSMSSPNVAGTLALLQQHYQNTHSSVSMWSATLKGLAIHTADEAGPNDGPDYMFGWGLLNAKAAAKLITNDANGKFSIDEQVLNDGNTYSTTFDSDGIKPIKVTICWTDPPGTPFSSDVPSDYLNNRAIMLVNDLDLVLKKDVDTFYPWKLDPVNPSFAATNSDKNFVDNVEQVYIASPDAGTYTIKVSHAGSLPIIGGQAFSIIVSGNGVCTDGSIIYNSDTGKLNFCEDGMWVEK